MLMMMMMALHMAMVPMAVSAPVASMVCDVAQLPHARQGAAAAAWRGHVLVVAGSWAPNCTAPGPAVVHYSDVLINAADGSWDTLADMGVGNARTHHAIAVVGDHLYVLGGCVHACLFHRTLVHVCCTSMCGFNRSQHATHS